jgi:hypothetical protein
LASACEWGELARFISTLSIHKDSMAIPEMSFRCKVYIQEMSFRCKAYKNGQVDARNVKSIDARYAINVKWINAKCQVDAKYARNVKRISAKCHVDSRYAINVKQMPGMQQRQFRCKVHKNGQVDARNVKSIDAKCLVAVRYARNVK